MIGQPKSYSSMLWRIWMSTTIVGILSTILLAHFSPNFQGFVNSIPGTYEFKGVELPNAIVFIPLLLAFVSRIIRLHNQISKLLGIRRAFDVNHILIPMAQMVGITVTNKLKREFKKHRHDLMRKVFYRYVPNVDKAVINPELVITALDNWGWLWCFVEASAIVILGALASIVLKAGIAVWIFLLASVVFSACAAAFWPGCKIAARNQYDEFLSDQSRRSEVEKEFNAL
jgi:hypothetical protein